MDTVKKAGVESEWTIDSAAIGSWHVGKRPDSRAQKTMRDHNLPYNNTAQQVIIYKFLKSCSINIYLMYILDNRRTFQ